MYFYIDESGQTGNNLFDSHQPIFYYGVVGSNYDLDICAVEAINKIKNKLGVECLHANELGVGGIESIINELEDFIETYEISYDYHTFNKSEYVIISFFDQVFDSGINKALSFTHYNSGLRYPLLLNLALLFDIGIQKAAWSARICLDKQKSDSKLSIICTRLLSNIDLIADQRIKEIVSDALTWAKENSSSIGYNCHNHQNALNVSPNLINFQAVIFGIGECAHSASKTVQSIIADEQSQFNKSQKELLEFNQIIKNTKIDFPEYVGLPKEDYSKIPEIALKCLSDTDSIGLEVVDILLWLTKRYLEKKKLTKRLEGFARDLIQGSKFHKDISLNSIIILNNKFLEESFSQPLSQQDYERGKAFGAELEQKRRLSIFK